MAQNINYISQINGFWEKSRDSDLKAIDISTYMALVDYWNSLGWMTPFVCHWEIVCQRSKTSKNAFYSSIERLHDAGFVIWQKGERSKKQPKITVLEMKNSEGTSKEHRGNNRGTSKEHRGNLYKLLNSKTIKLIEDNSELIKSKLQFWIDNEKNNKDNPNAIPSIEDVEYFAIEFALKHNKDKQQCISLATKGYNNYLENDWKDVNGNAVKNWKTKLQNSYLSLEKLKDAVDPLEDNYNKSMKWLLDGNRTYEDIDYCLRAYNYIIKDKSGSYKNELPHLTNVLKYKKLI